MKSLWKISSRYIMTAVISTVFIVAVNLAAILYVGYSTIQEGRDYSFSRSRMEAVSREVSELDGAYRLTEEGYRLLEEGKYAWVMLVDGGGNVAWSYQLPGEIPLHYELSDIAVLSRWYLQDYPVTVWKQGSGVMVYGYPKDSFARFNLISNVGIIENFPKTVWKLFLLNLLLLFGLVLLLAYRFYRSLKPLAGGIEGLAGKELVQVPEQGMVKELAHKLNQSAAMLKEQDALLQRRDDARSSWIAGVSHDIRTPLALITGYSDEILHEELTVQEVRSRAEAIQKQSLILKELVENLNLTSKLEYQAQPLSREPVSPALLLRECVAEYYNQGLEEAYEIELSIDARVENQVIWADRGLLLRAFRNLIGNSIRHNPQGCRIMVKLRPDGEQAQFLFADSGSGIPERVVKALAREAAWQEGGQKEQETVAGETSHAARTDQAEVHVMGLRIVRQIVTAHGGRLHFLKNEKEGYDVCMELAFLYFFH